MLLAYRCHLFALPTFFNLEQFCHVPFFSKLFCSLIVYSFKPIMSSTEHTSDSEELEETDYEYLKNSDEIEELNHSETDCDYCVVDVDDSENENDSESESEEEECIAISSDDHESASEKSELATENIEEEKIGSIPEETTEKTEEEKIASILEETTEEIEEEKIASIPEEIKTHEKDPSKTSLVPPVWSNTGTIRILTCLFRFMKS